MLDANELKQELLTATEGASPENAWILMLTAIEDYIQDKAEVHATFSGNLGSSPSPLNGPHVLNLITNFNKAEIEAQAKAVGGMPGFNIALHLALSGVYPGVNEMETIQCVPESTMSVCNLFMDTHLKDRDGAMMGIAFGIVLCLKLSVFIPPTLAIPAQGMASGSTGILTLIDIS